MQMYTDCLQTVCKIANTDIFNNHPKVYALYYIRQTVAGKISYCACFTDHSGKLVVTFALTQLNKDQKKCS